MSLPLEIFRRFGLTALLPAVAGGAAIWALAHYTAAPGGQVSVLWGLAQYTKAATSPNPVISVDAPSNATSSASAERPAELVAKSRAEGQIELISHGYTAENYSQRQSEIRHRYALRELSELESGKAFGSMPRATFGFLSTMDLVLRQTPVTSWLPTLAVRRFASSDALGPFVEVQSLQGRRTLLGFTTESSASRLTSSITETDVVLSARPRGDLSALVALDVDILRRVALRLIDSSGGKGYFVLDIALTHGLTRLAAGGGLRDNEPPRLTPGR